MPRRKYRHVQSFLDECYKIAEERADIVFSVSEEMHRRFVDKVPVSRWIPNGFNEMLFSSRHIPKAPDLPRNGGKIIGYVGRIGNRLDVDLLRKLASELPGCSIVFVGPVLDPGVRNSVVDMKNIRFLGERPYKQIPSYIAAFDVAIIPHRDSRLTKSMNPLKAYEYVASGKPVVAIGTSGIANIPGIKTTKTHEEFISLVKRALSDPWPVPSYEKIREEYSWEGRILGMLEVIQESLERGRSTTAEQAARSLRIPDP
jgi:glycosyltransferase involved in cell wall biosynthesis